MNEDEFLEEIDEGGDFMEEIDEVNDFIEREYGDIISESEFLG